MSESTSGEGYVEAVDDAGEPGDGADTSGAQYVDPAQHGDPAARPAGDGYVTAVDGRNETDGGEDVSGSGYVSEEP